MHDARFWLLREALASYASDPGEPPVRDGEVLQAAVSLVVRGGRALDVLLIKRAVHEGDPWSGHVALPGGRREPEDRSLLHTAVRETAEETAVDLSRGVRLGRLEEVTPQSTRLPRLTIHPFVFGVPPNTKARVASPEVDAVHWVSLPELRAPGTRSTVEISLPDGIRAFPCLRVRGEVVWGLTYRILKDFFRIYPDDAFRETV
ncbi:MAG TPA: CoA pyrophosphatase [Longimicrobiales bacterium]|nr:CoA pyrophosphatase [Longimicrobiales bacterium]